MKKKIAIIILLVLMVVGYAAVNTTLNINGSAKIAFNLADFDVYFSKTVLDEVDVTNKIIDANKKTFTFTTKPLYNVGDKSVVDFELTNISTQYDANVRINCRESNDDNWDPTSFDRDPEFLTVKARSTTAGKITIELIQKGSDAYHQAEFVCWFDMYAIERTVEETGEILPRGYYTYGFLEYNGVALSERDYVLYSDHAYYGKTDRRGLLFMQDIPYNDYDIYVIPKGVTNFKGLSKEELERIAETKMNLSLENKLIKFDDPRYSIDDCYIAWGEPSTQKVIFDFGEGTDENFESIILQDHKLGTLPNANHATLALMGWYYNGKAVTSDEIIKNNTITLKAQYGKGVARVNGTTSFKTLNDAFNNVNTDSATIDLLTSTSLEENITTDKNITLNLNGYTVNFANYNINNLGNLTINKGNISAIGDSVLINRGTMNVNKEVVINHNNPSANADLCRVLHNELNSTLNVNNVTINSTCSTNVDDNYLIFNAGVVNVADSTFKTHEGKFLYSRVGSNSNINNSNVEGEFTKNLSSVPLFAIFGNVVIDGGIYNLASTSTNPADIFIANGAGKLNLKSGTFDASNGDGNVVFGSDATTINIGSKGKNTYFVGNATNTYIINSQGTLNLNAGNIIANNGHLLISTNEINIGSSENKPVIEGARGYQLIELRGATGTISNANIKSFDYIGLILRENSTLDINNIEYTHTAENAGIQPIIVESSVLNIYDGSIKLDASNTAALGLISGQGTSTINLNGGTYDGTTGLGNVINTTSESRLNIDAGSKDITFVGNASNSYTISTSGTIDIKSGNVIAKNGYFLGASGDVIIGSSNKTPTIRAAKGFGIMDIRNSGTINNVNMYSDNNVMMYVYPGAILDINNANLVGESTSSSFNAPPIQVNGTLNIYGGTYKTSDNNTYLDGMFSVSNGATLNLAGGTLDATTSNGNFIFVSTGTTLNIGATGKKVITNGVNSGSSLIYSLGTTNILDGSLEINNEIFIINAGDFFIGSQTRKPNIIVNSTMFLFEVGNTTINNVDMTVKESMIANIQPQGILTINNGEITQELTDPNNNSFAFGVLGSMIVNGGTIKDNTNTSSQGLVLLNQEGSLNLNGGTLDGSNSLSPVYLAYATVQMNMKNGTIKANNNNTAVMIQAGKFIMSGGSIINSGYGYTIYNAGGIATQTGGTSAKNYGVS